MNYQILLFLFVAIFARGAFSGLPEKNHKSTSVLDYTLKSIDGQDVDLQDFHGKVVMIVNVASKCGLTSQYKALQTIYEKYSKKGFVILGFPANNFFRQEPGTNSDIKLFCTTNYGVTFPMFSKISIKGKDKHPLYIYLTEKQTNPHFAGEIKWNFTKFLIGKDGNVLSRFEPRTKPDSKNVMSAIEKALFSS